MFKFRLEPRDEIEKPFKSKKSSSWCSKLCEPDYWHLFVFCAIHTVIHIATTYYLLMRLPKEAIAKMTIPTNLETTQAIAETFKSLMATNGWDINALLLTTFFYF